MGLLKNLKRKAVLRLRGEVALAVFRTFAARSAVAFGSLFLIVILGQQYGPVGVGVFSLAQSLIIAASILARYGMNNALMRFVGRDPSNPNIVIYMRWACAKSLPLSLILAVAIYLFRDLIESIFESDGLSAVLVGVAIATPAFTLSYLISGFCKGIRKSATASLLENGSISLVTSSILVFFNQFIPDAGLVAVGWAYAISAWLVFAHGIIHFCYWKSKQRWSQGKYTHFSKKERKVFNSTSQSFFIISLAGFMQNSLSILIVSWFLSSAEVGLFQAALQAAMLINFILIVINAIFPPRFAYLFHRNEKAKLALLARQGALLGMILAMPFFFLCLFFPRELLELISSDFTQADSLLQVMALAQLINVATGSVGLLLNMTGYEKLMRNITLICNGLGMVLLVILTPTLGIFGSSLAFSAMLVLQNLTALVFVWRRLGIWMLPLPNLLKLLGVRTRSHFI